LKLVVLHG